MVSGKELLAMQQGQLASDSRPPWPLPWPGSIWRAGPSVPLRLHDGSPAHNTKEYKLVAE